ncbi:MAG: hypothetical protein QUV05_21450 [Phycisphaerae bacterium]|nr:hypothetical protein [Phycisphaerae bacterium]
MSKRFHQILLMVSFVAFSWLAMQAVHELGHVLGAKMTGGTVIRAVLHPLALSRTDVSPNPRPLVVVWAGPIFGAFLPLVVCLIASLLRSPGLYLFRFFAGFCLVANGAYIAAGSLQEIADAGDMLRYGSHHWQLLLFGLITVPLGLCLWNGLGSKFGLGQAKGQVSRTAALISFGLLVLIVAAEILWTRRS